jgi:sulfide:quinone oxidoreductase
MAARRRPIRGDASFDVVIVGAGAAGIAVAASLKSRKPGLEIAIIDPADIHYYQPGWTMVGGGIFEAADHRQDHGQPDPQGRALDQVRRRRLRAQGQRRHPRWLPRGEIRPPVVCPGPQARLGKVEGLEETLGRNGVTSNYRYDLAPYTWELVQGLKEGRAIFTQPPMPIKCAGAPQKAMYLSGDHWHRAGVLTTSTSSS